MSENERNDAQMILAAHAGELVWVLQWTQEQYLAAGSVKKIKRSAATLGLDIDILDRPDQSDPTRDDVYIVLRPKAGREG